MGDSGIIKDIAGLSEPATKLIEKVSEGVGGFFKPYQIKRVAKAEAEAEIIKTEGKIQATELEKRAINRFIEEEAKHQANMESITGKAITYLEENAHPEKIENDWISNFFDKCRLISDDEMQILWAKLLAGEANKTGSYSKRTVNFVASMDKKDALSFTKLCSFILYNKDVPYCFIYDLNVRIYNENNINYETLKHLDSIGMIYFEGNVRARQKYRTEFVRHDTQSIYFTYFGTPIYIVVNQSEPNYTIDIGYVYFSRIGEELAPIAGSKANPVFIDYLIDVWISKGYNVSRTKPI